MRFSIIFFFFKQKTAYEMRISDWSSDVCSSDLPNSPRGRKPRAFLLQQERLALLLRSGRRWRAAPDEGASAASCSALLHEQPESKASLRCARAPSSALRRSEEHTSELQSLMRISYAVFCLKQKKRKRNITQ